MTQDAIYLRKSRADIELEKIEHFETLARHKKILLDVAQKMNLNVVKIFEEIVSGESIQARPQMQQLLNEVSAGLYDNVLVMEVERLARGNTRDQGIVAETFQYSNTKIVTPAKVYDPQNEFDQEYFEFGLFMSRREYKTIQRRLNTGRLSSTQDGNYIAAKPPYGYDIVHPDKKTYTLAFNEETKYLKMMKDWRLNENLSPGEIARRLTSMGVPTRSGNTVWNSGTITGILINPVYAGYVKWNTRKTIKHIEDGQVIRSRPRAKQKDIILAEGKHPAAFTKEEHERLVASFDLHSPTLQSDKQLVNPLANLIFCKKCGKAFTYHKYKGCQDRYVHQGTGCSCKVKSATVNEVLEILIQALNEQIHSFENLVNLTAEKHYNPSEEMIAEYEKELDGLKKQREKLFDYFERELYSEQEFLERKKALAEKIDKMEQLIYEERKKEPVRIDYKAKIVSFQEAVDTLRDNSVPAKQKNKLLKEIIERIDYYNEGTVGINHSGVVHLDIYFK